MAFTDSDSGKAFWPDVLRFPTRILASGLSILIIVYLWRWLIGTSFKSPLELAPGSSWEAITIGMLVFAVAAGLVIFLWWLSARFFNLIGLEKIPGSTIEAIKDLPMGLPEGTVRAILALVVAVVGLPLLLFQGILDIDAPIAGYINGIIAGVFGFYFGARTSGVPTKAVDKIADAQQTAIRKTDEAAAAKVEAANAQSEVDAAKAEVETVKSDAADQLKRATDASSFDKNLNQVQRHLALANIILKTFAPVLPQGMLAPKTAETLADAEKILASLQNITAASATQEQLDALSTLAERVTGSASPVAALLKNAAPLFANVGPIAGLGPVASLLALLGLGAKLGSSQYLRWRARVLAAPIGQGLVAFGTVTPEIIHAALKNAPRLRQALATQDPVKVESVLANVIASPEAAHRLLAEYGPGGRAAPNLITDLGQAQAAVAELGRAVLSLYSANDLEPATVRQVTEALSNAPLLEHPADFHDLSPSNANGLVDAVSGVSTRANLPQEQRAAFDALVMLVDAARRQNIDLVAALAELRQ